jgi:hypothetical protein
MAFKMKGHTLPGIKQKNGGKVDLTKTPVGPVAEKKSTYNEEEEQIIENMDNAKDNNFDGHMEIGINKGKKKSPTKWVQFIPAAISAVSAISKMGKKKEQE